MRYIKQTIRRPLGISGVSAAFTIVELLIVIVVIAILAAITIVAYTGIANQAKEATLKSDLRSAATQLGIAKVDTGSYPADDSTLKKSIGTTFQYTSSTSTYCLTATSTNLPGKPFYVDQNGSVQAGTCPGSVATIAGPMQSFTQSQCAALTTFTGSNPEAVIGLTDSRGGVTRTYQVAKLADNHCWMLTNLKLGSTTSTITLTPSDSNVASNFTLPQLITSGNEEYDLPRAYGPVPGDTGAGATNYGYLYNWAAATAGETRTTMPGNGINGNIAPHSICPANWKLPTGNDATGDFGKLDVAFGGTGVYAAGGPSAPKWQADGAFKGVISGLWLSGFAAQGTYGYWWSSSAYPGNPTRAYHAAVNSTGVNPGDNVVRYVGVGLRCLLN